MRQAAAAKSGSSTDSLRHHAAGLRQACPSICATLSMLLTPLPQASIRPPAPSQPAMAVSAVCAARSLAIMDSTLVVGK